MIYNFDVSFQMLSHCKYLKAYFSIHSLTAKVLKWNIPEDILDYSIQVNYNLFAVESKQIVSHLGLFCLLILFMHFDSGIHSL